MARVRGSSRRAPPTRDSLARRSRSPSPRMTLPIMLNRHEQPPKTGPACRNLAGYTDTEISDARNRLASIAVVTPKVFVNVYSFAPPSLTEQLAPSRTIPKQNVINERDTNGVNYKSSANGDSRAHQRHALPDVERSPIPSPTRLHTVSECVNKQRKLALEDGKTKYSSRKSLRVGMPPAPNEANELRRAAKYGPGLQEEHEMKRKCLVRNSRANKPPHNWEFPVNKSTKGKGASATTAKKEGIVVPRLLSPHSRNREVASPVFQVLGENGIEDPRTIHFEDRLYPGPVSKRIDYFVPRLSIQDQERGIMDRTPDPFPRIPVDPMFQAPTRVTNLRDPGPRVPMLASEYQRVSRLIHFTQPKVPVSATAAAEMGYYFDFDAASTRERP